MHYVDGFVLVVPKKKLAAYKKMAALGGKMWKKHGALDYIEAVIEDPKPKFVKLTFPKLTKAKPSDVVIFSFITYKNRAHRDKVNAKVMKDPSMQQEGFDEKHMPFDMSKMAYGGFKAFVDM